MHPQGDVGVNGNIQGSFAIGANDRVVYIADETVENVSELFSVPADGSASRVRLSEAGLNVYPFKLTPAKTHVLYENGSPFTFTLGLGPLFVVPIDGSSAPINLTPGLIVHRFWISPDGATTVFSAEAALEELYTVPSDGSGSPLLLTQAHPSPRFGSVYFDGVVFTPDGLWVVYNEVDDFDDELEHDLYSVPLDASQPEASITNSPHYAGKFALDPATVPVRVAFVDSPGVASTAADGSQFVQLSPAGWSSFGHLLVVGTDVFFDGFQSGTGTTIYRAAIDGSQPAAALFPAGPQIASFLLASPTEIALVRYFAGSARQLSVVPLAGGAPVPLHTLPPSGQGPFYVAPHPDGQRVLFSADNDTAGVFELYVAPLDASSAPTRLNGPLGSNDDVKEVKVTPDEAHVAFRAGPGSGGQVELFHVALDASSLLQLNESFPVGNTLGDVLSFRLTPDRGSLVYRADQDVDEDIDLYALNTSAPGSPLQLSSGLPNVLSEFAFSPLSDRVVFQTQGAPFALHNADLAGGSPIALDTSTVAFPTGFEVSADGTRLVYRRQSSGLSFELCSVAMDGLSAPVVLHAPLPTGRTVSQFQISPGGVVVFHSDLGQDELYELYAVPIDGSAQPLRLNQTLAAGGDVTSFRIDANGGFAVYIADARLNNRFELYSVPLDSAPLDASRRPARLNSKLPAGGDVTDFALTPDGKRAVYRADQVSENRFDLFSVPIEGSSPPHGQPGGARRSRVTILSAVPSGRSVEQGWSISPDGTQVVYRADADAAAVFELYRAPVDGGVAPAKLSAAPVSNGDVLSFAIAPDQSRVVYRADQRVDEVIELFSAPFLGGTVAQLDLLPNFGDVSAFQIAPGSSDVVFLADRDTDAVSELFRVPLDGSAPSVKVNASLPPGGAVQTDFVALDDGTLYRADQEENDVFELFLEQ